MRDVLILAIILIILFISIMAWHKNNVNELLARENDKRVDITFQNKPNKGLE